MASKYLLRKKNGNVSRQQDKEIRITKKKRKRNALNGYTLISPQKQGTQQEAQTTCFFQTI